MLFKKYNNTSDQTTLALSQKPDPTARLKINNKFSK